MGPTMNNAQAILASLRSVGNSLVSGVNALSVRENGADEKIDFVKFAKIEYEQDSGAREGGTGVPVSKRVLLLGYASGFQVWDVDSGHEPREIVSRREEAVRYLDVVPRPYQPDAPGCPLYRARPCLAVIPADITLPSAASEQDEVNGIVRFYSLQTHTTVHSLSFKSRVLTLRTSKRIVVVAVDAQIFGYDAVTLECTMSSLTYPAPCTKHLMQGEVCCEGTAVPLALGPRWIAFASNSVQTAAGCAVAQRIVSHTNGEMRLSSSLEAVSQFAKTAAKHSGKQLRVLGEAGIKYISNQYEHWMANGHDTNGGSPSFHSERQDHQAAADAAVVGTVQVRDVVSRTTVAHFRAHDSPLLLLEFDPSGTLLVTASIHGHSINIFQLCPVPVQQGNAKSRTGTANHLFKLSRGMTPATIQHVSFSNSGDLLCVSSARGTTHLFRLCQPGDAAGPAHLRAAASAATHGASRKAVKLGAAGRIHNTPLTSLNPNLPGSLANAAASLYAGMTGGRTVSTMFVPRGEDAKAQRLPHRHEPSSLLEEDLYIASDDGRLLRNQLCLHVMQGDSEENCNGSSYSSTPESSVSVIEDNSCEVRAETVNAWQLCRQRGWHEREDFFEEEDIRIPAELSEAEQRRAWMANAETCLHVPHRQPLWNDGQFTILEMQPVAAPPSPTGTAISEAAWPQGPRAPEPPALVLQVEDIPTKRVNIARGELSPVITEGAGSAVVRRPSLAPTVLHYDVDPSNVSNDPASAAAWGGPLQPDNGRQRRQMDLLGE